MSEHAVVIAGAGPTGLVLAGELALADVDVIVVEPRTTQVVDGSRAGGLHARTLEVLDQRGIAERFVSAGQTYPVVAFGGIPLTVGDLPTRHNYLLGLWQSAFEPILADWVTGAGVPVRRGVEVVDCRQDGSGVDVDLSDGTGLRGQFLVGCDGGRSTVRRSAGIDFVGTDASTSWMIAEVDMTAPTLGLRPEGGGIGPVDRAGDGGPYRVVLTEQPPRTGTPDLAELRDALVAVYGSDFAVRRPTWISRFSDVTRQAVTYRSGRVLLAGDAAHVHPPQGGQGLNVGVQDAVNLGWKLARVVNGTGPEGLLDTYHAERHPVAARVLRTSLAQVALAGAGPRHEALRATVGGLLAMDGPRRSVAAMLSGLDVAYDPGGGHPLVGRRMPDLDLVSDDGPVRVFTLLHDARGLLVNLGVPGAFDVSPWAGRVRIVDARYDGRWELPVLGEVAPPGAVLVRPDGHVAWVGAPDDPTLPGALTSWFGPARPGERPGNR